MNRKADRIARDTARDVAKASSARSVIYPPPNLVLNGLLDVLDRAELVLSGLLVGVHLGPALPPLLEDLLPLGDVRGGLPLSQQKAREVRGTRGEATAFGCIVVIVMVVVVVVVTMSRHKTLQEKGTEVGVRYTCTLGNPEMIREGDNNDQTKTRSRIQFNAQDAQNGRIVRYRYTNAKKTTTFSCYTSTDR